MDSPAVKPACLTPGDTEMIEVIRKSLPPGTSESDAIRYAVVNAYMMQQCIDEGMHVQVVDNEGKVRAYIFK